MAQPKSNKRERERQRQEKAAAKAVKRSLRLAGDGSEPEQRSDVDQEQVLVGLAELHQRYEDEQISLDDFLEQKAELTARLVVPDS